MSNSLIVNSTGSVKMEFVLIPAGEFDMGSPASEEGRRDDEGPVHRVKISKPFCMGRFPVTAVQYKALMDWSFVRSYTAIMEMGSLSGRCMPMRLVSWYNAAEFCEKLSRKTGKRCRLPTEAEWEYACRAGTTTPFSFGETISTDQANYHGGDTYGTGPAGVFRAEITRVDCFRPNAFGLYDMHGNVDEWCQDWYGAKYYSRSPEADPQGERNGSGRVLRGGHLSRPPHCCRSATRDLRTGGGASVWVFV